MGNSRKINFAFYLLYAFEASRDYDPEPALGKIKAKILTVSFADDMINAVEFGIVEWSTAKVPNARSVAMAATDRIFRGPESVRPRDLAIAPG